MHINAIFTLNIEQNNNIQKFTYFYHPKKNNLSAPFRGVFFWGRGCNMGVRTPPSTVSIICCTYLLF